MKVTVRYHLSMEARKKAIVETGADPGRQVSATIELNTPESRQTWVDAFGVNTIGDVTGNDPSVTTLPRFERRGSAMFVAVKGLPAELDKMQAEADLLQLISNAAQIRLAEMAQAEATYQAEKAETAQKLDIYKPIAEALKSAKTWDDYRAITIPPELVGWTGKGQVSLRSLEKQLTDRLYRDDRDAAIAAREAETAAWIEAHGSDHIKLAAGRGHRVDRLYALERAQREFPDFTLDYAGTSDWNERTNPPVSELMAAEAAEKQHNRAVQLVWLTSQPSPNPVNYDSNYIDDFEPGPALVIKRFLDKYVLIKTL